MAEHKIKVFISYSRKDRSDVARLSKALEAEDDIEVFRDTEDILPTEEWRQRLEQLIGEADTIVFVLSPHSAASEVCAWEVEHAESLNKRIAPIVIADVPPADIPGALTKYNYIFFTAKDDFNQALDNLVRALNTDIDWIREHTRLGELARRWDTQRRLGAQPLRARELAAAETWLAQQPRNAPPPTSLHRQYVQFSRHRATRRQQYWVAGSLSAALMTSVLAGFAYLQKQEADAQRSVAIEQRGIAETNEKRAVQERERAEAERVRAEQTLEQALSAADTLVEQIAGNMKDFERVPIERIRTVLEKAEAVLEGLKRTGSTQAVQHSRLAMLISFVDAYITLGELDAAELRVEAAKSLLADLSKADKANISNELKLARVLSQSGTIRVDRGDLAGASAAYQDSYSIRKRLADANPDDLAIQDDLARSHIKIGLLHWVQGDREAARNAYRTGLAIQERLVEADPKNKDWQQQLANTFDSMAVLLTETANPDMNVHALFDKALKIRERLAYGDPTNALYQHNLTASYTNFGKWQVSINNLQGGLDTFLDGLAIIKRLASSNPGNVDWQKDLSRLHARIGEVQQSRGDLAGALSSLQDSLEINKRLSESSPTNDEWKFDLSVSHIKVGDVEKALGDLKAARWSFVRSMHLKESLAIERPNNRHWQRHLYLVYQRLGSVGGFKGDQDDAIDYYRKSLAVAEALAASNPENRSWQHDLSLAHRSLGYGQKSKGLLDAALQSYRKSLEVAEKLVVSEPEFYDWIDDHSKIYNFLGNFLMQQKDRAGALALFRDYLDISRRFGSAYPASVRWQINHSTAHWWIGLVQRAQGDWDNALKSFRDSLIVVENHLAADPDEPGRQGRVARALLRLGKLLAQMNRKEDAVATLKRGRAIVQAMPQNAGLEEWKDKEPDFNREIGKLGLE